MSNQKWYDCNGQEISASRIENVDFTLGIADYVHRVTCNVCCGKGERNHFYRSNCHNCHGTGYSLITKRTAYQLFALKRIKPVIGRDIEFKTRMAAGNAQADKYNIWYMSHQNVVDAINSSTRENNFLMSLKSILEKKFTLSEKQILAAAKILGVNAGGNSVR